MIAEKRFTGRQLTVVVVAVCVAVVAAPVAAFAATGSFSSSSAKPAVSAKNTSSASGAKAVYGNASATIGTTYGVYGRSRSADGYGVYSAGRLGSSGALVCSHCVTGADINAATLPKVPDASKLGDHGPSYFARIVPLSALLPTDPGCPNACNFHPLAHVDGLTVSGGCNATLQVDAIAVTADSASDDGTVNFFYVTSPSTASAGGVPVGTSRQVIATSVGAVQTEGSVIYRNNATGRIITINFHLYGANCELFGDVVTAG
jgi:hypothetical protein